MATTASPSTAAGRSVAVLERLFAGYRGDGFDVRLWDGTTWRPSAAEEPRLTIVLRHEGSLRAMLWPPGELTLSEAYVYGDFELEGDLEAVFPLADALLAERPQGRAAQLALARQLRALPEARRERPSEPKARLRGRRHSVERDRAAVDFHYGRSNKFFAAFLDPRLVYSCAYFAGEDDDLATAQERKLDLVCRKLRVERGDRLLDVGCGWGGLVLYAAERYGADAFGVTLSESQAELARERIRAAGLEGRCRVDVRDYRELEGETFDKVASIGMFEHVGEDLLPEYFGRVRDALRPGGVFLNHGIARPVWRPATEGSSFVERYVFPDGELSPISVSLRAAEEAGFEVRDVESLREHYALTLRHWVRRLEQHESEAIAAAGEPSYRVWRLYMAGSAHAFTTGRVSVYQTLLVKPDRGRSGLPLTRADWYL